MPAAGTLKVLPALDPDNRRLVVIVTGNRIKGTLEWAVHGPWLQQYAHVAILDHPDRGFSVEDEARLLTRFIASHDSDEVWVAACCLGMQVGRRLVAGMRCDPKLRGLVVPCGYNGTRYLQGPPPWVWWLGVWIANTRPWSRAMKRLARRRGITPPGPPSEPGADPDAIRRWRAYLPTMSWSARAWQAWAGLLVRPLMAGEWGWLPVAQIAARSDQVIRQPESATAIAQANRAMLTVWLEPDQAGHQTLLLHPTAWAKALAIAFGHTGLAVDPTTVGQAPSIRGDMMNTSVLDRPTGTANSAELVEPPRMGEKTPCFMRATLILTGLAGTVAGAALGIHRLSRGRRG
jgi:hypothetical protein